jgi:SAM-dependent methyltransferase
MADYDPAAYGNAWVRDYDSLYDSRDDPEIIVAALGDLVAGRSLLELGIGTGRLAIPLHDAGWHVVGVEASDAMVAELHKRAGDRRIPVHQADMRTARLDEQFDAVLLAFSTLFLLPDQRAQVECLATAAHHLTPEGLLIVEAFVPDHTRWTDGKRLALSRWMDDGIEIEAARHDRALQTIEVRYLAVGARTGMRPLRLRYAWPAEIDLMARLAGLGRVDRWAEWSGTPFDASSTGHVSLYGRLSEARD